MADFTNIPTGLKITSQIPLNTKEYVQNEATLSYLGLNDNLAYTYYEDIEIFCIDEKTLYKWREVQVGEENTGLVPLDFTYPALTPDTFGISYANRKFNFFEIEYVTSNNIDEYIQNFVTLNNVGTGAKIYKENTYFDLKTLTSDNLEITEEINQIKINTPISTSNLSFYVDVNSTASSETGTLASPFKTLNKALDAFIGTGTWYNPQYNGYKITLLSSCGLLETAGVDYNGYVNLDINNLFIEGNDFYLQLAGNPSVDYYPISTRRMVTDMPKTSSVLDYAIHMRFNNIILQRIGTNAIIDNLNYSFPTATIGGAFPPEQNQVNVIIENCTFTNDSTKLPNPNWTTVPNPNDSGNPLLMFGVPVYASINEPIGVPMIKSEGRNWNKEGNLQIINSSWRNSTGTNISFKNTTYQDYGQSNIMQSANYFRYYESVVDDFYSPRLDYFLVTLEDVNYCRLTNITFNNTIPSMLTTEVSPRNIQIGGVEAAVKLINSNFYIDGANAEESVYNFCQLDGTSTIELKDFSDFFINCNEEHGFFKVITPLPVTAKSIYLENSSVNEVVVDETGVDKSYILEIVGYKNTVNNAPHSSYLSYVDNTAAKAAGLIKGNVYYDTTLGGLNTVI